jgi:hypothetical protein
VQKPQSPSKMRSGADDPSTTSRYLDDPDRQTRTVSGGVAEPRLSRTTYSPNRSFWVRPWLMWRLCGAHRYVTPGWLIVAALVPVTLIISTG